MTAAGGCGETTTAEAGAANTEVASPPPPPLLTALLECQYGSAGCGALQLQPPSPEAPASASAPPSSAEGSVVGTCRAAPPEAPAGVSHTPGSTAPELAPPLELPLATAGAAVCPAEEGQSCA